MQWHDCSNLGRLWADDPAEGEPALVSKVSISKYKNSWGGGGGPVGTFWPMLKR